MEPHPLAHRVLHPLGCKLRHTSQLGRGPRTGKLFVVGWTVCLNTQLYRTVATWCHRCVGWYWRSHGACRQASCHHIPLRVPLPWQSQQPPRCSTLVGHTGLSPAGLFALYCTVPRASRSRSTQFACVVNVLGARQCLPVNELRVIQSRSKRLLSLSTFSTYARTPTSTGSGRLMCTPVVHRQSYCKCTSRRATR